MRKYEFMNWIWLYPFVIKEQKVWFLTDPRKEIRDYEIYETYEMEK
jgi:hypothetical protein